MGLWKRTENLKYGDCIKKEMLVFEALAMAGSGHYWIGGQKDIHSLAFCLFG